MKVSFREHIYDKDGDLNESGIFLHFGENLILKLKNFADLKDTINNMSKCAIEIAELNQ